MARFSILKFIRDQRQPLPPVLQADLLGKTVIVTGANGGLGLAAAKHFARMKPARLILACRSQVKGEVAVEDIQEETGYTAEVRLLDQSRFASVIAFVTALEEENARVDIVVANIGMSTNEFELTPDGYERILQVNHLSTALLSIRLLPVLQRTAQEFNVEPRLTVVASETHLFTRIRPAEAKRARLLSSFSDPDYCNFAIMADRYNLSKLLNLFTARSLAKHLLPTSPLIVDSVNPGLCDSNITDDVPWIVQQFDKILKFFLGRTSEQGARTYIWAALAGDESLIGGGNKQLRESLKGAYSGNCDFEEESDYVFTAEGQEAERRVWVETLEILEGVDPKIREIRSAFMK